MFESAPDILTVKQVTDLLPLGKNSVYALIHDGRIRTVRVGRRLLVPKLAIISFVETESGLANTGYAYYNYSA